MKSKDLLKELEAQGWKVIRVKGSHHQLAHSIYGHTITIPHPKKDLPKGLVQAIRKQAKNNTEINHDV